MRLATILLGITMIGGSPLGLYAQGGGAQGRQADAVTGPEQRLFEAHRQEPIALLRSLYEEKKVLVLAANHGWDYTWLLLPLLEQVGTDPALRYIAAERDYFTTPTLHKLSVTPTSEAELPQRLTLYERQLYCFTGEWNADLVRLLPMLQRLNARRPAAKPVLFSGIDGGMLAWRAHASGREVKTTAEFARLLASLAPSEKMIVVYNFAHILKGGTIRNHPHSQQVDNWVTQFLQAHPEARSELAIVKLEGKAHAASPEQSWGIRLAALQSIPRWVRYAENSRYDAVIWWANPMPYDLGLASRENAGLGPVLSSLKRGVALDSIEIKPIPNLPTLCSVASIRALARAWVDSMTPGGKWGWQRKQRP